MSGSFAPRVTVAAVVERDGRWLVVEEVADGATVLNQPAGHVDPGESVIEAVIRETHEETGWRFRPAALIGVYRWVKPDDGTTFFRFAFAGELVERLAPGPLDADIVATHWRTRAELAASALRSPLVLRCIDDHVAGHRHPLELLQDL